MQDGCGVRMQDTLRLAWRHGGGMKATEHVIDTKDQVGTSSAPTGSREAVRAYEDWRVTKDVDEAFQQLQDDITIKAGSATTRKQGEIRQPSVSEMDAQVIGARTVKRSRRTRRKSWIAQQS
eukprot:TRINITY_DN106687_c0_g1_i1.p1 TRINITY_DN106687_c0_g1~~TRINITY_DN106687_c0_g1_i1.p1  ORF type:complete len:122 (-),score=23.08 TRINITY_DN106687_c0_g1_i1:322-687(-)